MKLFTDTIASYVASVRHRTLLISTARYDLSPMDTTVTERSNCRFSVRRGERDKPQIVLELFQPISQLQYAKLGCEFLGGTTVDQEKIIAVFLNEHVLNIFVETLSREKKLNNNETEAW